jgi:Ala-tRNA(Pro) deacylase
MPPFGNIYLMPVVVDFDVARNEFIGFTVGTHRDAIRMSFEDYRRVARPVMAAITATAVEGVV